ncbi:hypothetical protein HW555_002755 [Spodoptera exigua]|uniref:Uncharacterized protein n=1 Tax=Spodoptera exigua TaxID=7107 RepID=A0A835L9Z8_SPOEX|nr:hypothetical protein HW555_002755 [Spodoptera exigua]
MRAFTRILALLSLFTVTFGDDQIISLEVTIPDMITTFTTIDRIFRALEGPDIDEAGDGNSMAANLLTKVKWYLYGYFSKMTNMFQLRRNRVKPNVELGIGTIKSEIINYPKDFLASRIRALLKLKQKRDEQKIG